MPGRRVILALAVRTDGGRTVEARRIYVKSFRDGEGRVVIRDGPVFAPGVRLDSDTRIRADEERVEEFSFPVSQDAAAHVSLKLHYEHSPMEGPENRTWLAFYTTERTFARGGR